MSLRLFAALPVPPEIASRLVGLQRGVPDANWRTGDMMHITLRFFGGMSTVDAEELDQELAQISIPPFALAVKGTGVFGRKERHALWMGVDAAPPLEKLARKCERAAQRVGLPAETRRFKPHVTMAYLKNSDPLKLAEFEKRHALFETPEWIADRFYLYSSWKRGFADQPYRIEAEYPLA